MKIALIEVTCPDIRAYGVRCLSSYLKRHGQDVRVIFLPPETELVRFNTGEIFQYRDSIIQGTIEHCNDVDLIGISFMTYYFDRIVQLTGALKKALNKPIIWGGVHATVRPDECLQHTDMVCLGEGEGAILELMQRMDRGEDYLDTRNFWFKRNGDIYRNPLRELITDVDKISSPDYDIEDHFCFDNQQDKVVRLDSELLKRIMVQGPLSPLGEMYHYKTMASRGCPHMCNYCCVSTYKKMYQGQKWLRWQSWPHFFSELKQVREKFPFINAICLFDDSLLAMPTAKFEEFCEIYKREIDLPLAAQVSPPTVTEAKMDALVNAGMKYIEMGIQSGSDRINAAYNRKVPKETVIRAAMIIHGYQDRILPPDFHLILDNPWAVEEDDLDTVRLGLELPRPYHLKPSSLVHYPGTEILERAKEDGLITDEKTEVYRKAFGAPAPTYLNLLIFFLDFEWMPQNLVRFLSSKRMVRLLNRNSLAPVFVLTIMMCSAISFGLRGSKAVFTGDFTRIKRFIHNKFTAPKIHRTAVVK